MQWQEVCNHPDLQNLPFKIELNERGQIVMSPVKVYHSAYQGEIGHWLRALLNAGKTLPECAIKTRKGTKVADVAWVSGARFQQIKQETECSVAPEICVEVLSSANSSEEIREKRTLYFECGAEEVWICTKQGKMRFFNRAGQLKASQLVPDFPQKIEL